MDGVVLFADNKVLDKDGFEYKLYGRLCKAGLSVLPICDLTTLEATIRSMSTFKALILDWNFNREDDAEDLDGVALPVATPEKLLSDIDIYSFIYVYSQIDNKIGDETKEKLNIKFPDKIRFMSKSQDGDIKKDVEREANKIISDITKFGADNKHMDIPFEWSQAINQSLQSIFTDLEKATPNWVVEIRDAEKDQEREGSSSEVINVFNSLVGEAIGQNVDLLRSIQEYHSEAQPAAQESTAKLYRRLLYTKVVQDAPIMTGDIFKISDNEYGILISPECDLGKPIKTFEVLVICKDDSSEFQKKKNNNKNVGVFNNGAQSRHVLISFPFDENKYNELALINFLKALRIYKKEELSQYERVYKLNTPYIHQLRQRYISYLGRYGVPAIPQSLKEYNLHN